MNLKDLLPTLGSTTEAMMKSIIDEEEKNSVFEQRHSSVPTVTAQSDVFGVPAATAEMLAVAPTANRDAPLPSRADILASYGVHPGLAATAKRIAPPPKREREDEGMTVRELLQYFQAVPKCDTKNKTEQEKSFMHKKSVEAYCKALAHALGKTFIGPKKGELGATLKEVFPELEGKRTNGFYFEWDKTICEVQKKEFPSQRSGDGYFLSLKSEGKRLLEQKKNKN